jgi:hypothetical protein
VRATGLRGAFILARTSEGNFAKFQIVPGPDLLISRLAVYDRNGCIIKLAANLTIHASQGCDLERARETTTRPDFWWRSLVLPGPLHREFYLESHPQCPVIFHVWKSFDDVTFAELRAAEYATARVDAPVLARQVLFCRSGAGRYAKLLVEEGTALTVRRLVVYEDGGAVRLSRSDLQMPPNSSLDLETGFVASAAGADRETADLWWLNPPLAGLAQTGRFLAPARGAAISFRSYFQMRKYRALLASAPIRNAMVFVDAGGTRSYDAWSKAEKLHLDEFLYLRESGAALPIAGPPPLGAFGAMTPCDAWKIYLAHVAQSLWADANGRVSWRLEAASTEHLEHLFDMRKLMEYENGHRFKYDLMGAVTDWSPEISYRFLADGGFVRADPWETIKALTEWCGANLLHMNATDGTVDQVYGYHGLPPVDRMIYPLPTARGHVTEACWCTSGFFAAVLRSVNIPVRHGRSLFDGLSHSRPEFFTVGQSLAHGDDPYNGFVKPGHNSVPVERIFFDDAALQAQIDNPAPLPGRTVSQTAEFNKNKRLASLGVEFLTDYPLVARCIDQRSGQTGTASELWQMLHDFYTDAEIDAIAARCDAETATIPRGCTSFFWN